MLKTNCKKAIENIRKYIIDNVDFCNYGLKKEPKTFEEYATTIMSICESEKKYISYRTKQDMFFDWLQGLPSCGLGDFFCRYPNTAKVDLMEILEETKEEAERFTDEEAEKMLVYLLYREISKKAYCEVIR